MHIKGHIKGLSQSLKHKKSERTCSKVWWGGITPHTSAFSVPPSTARGGGCCQEQGKGRDNATETAVAMELIQK